MKTIDTKRAEGMDDTDFNARVQHMVEWIMKQQEFALVHPCKNGLSDLEKQNYTFFAQADNGAQMTVTMCILQPGDIVGLDYERPFWFVALTTGGVAEKDWTAEMRDAANELFQNLFEGIGDHSARHRTYPNGMAVACECTVNEAARVKAQLLIEEKEKASWTRE
jgi:hypothetical protein